MILVSACLLGENCKYNGGNNENRAVISFLEGKPFLKICPETAGGLKSPRLPAEICGDRVFLKDGTDVTDAFLKGAETVKELAALHHAELAILKESSPSCGCHMVYDGSFTGKKVCGMGIAAKALCAMGICVKSETDIEKECQL